MLSSSKGGSLKDGSAKERWTPFTRVPPVSGGAGVYPQVAHPGPYRLQILVLPDGTLLLFALRPGAPSRRFYDLLRKAPMRPSAMPATAPRLNVGCICSQL